MYSAYQALIDRAGTDPAKDWTREVEAVATAVGKADLLKALAQTAASGQRTTGTTVISPTVVTAEPALVTIADCVDSSAADFLDAGGTSIKAPDAPGSYFRHTASAQVIQLQDGGWRVAVATDDWSSAC